MKRSQTYPKYLRLAIKYSLNLTPNDCSFGNKLTFFIDFLEIFGYLPYRLKHFKKNENNWYLKIRNIAPAQDCMSQAVQSPNKKLKLNYQVFSNYIHDKPNKTIYSKVN